jgi:type I restriction enzyme, S subunit
MKLKPGYKQTEVGVIPDDWDLKKLGEISSVSAGGTPSREKAIYWNGEIPWITTSEVDFSRIIRAEQFITKEGLKNSAAKLFRPGTLLMALYGQGKTRGKVGILGIEASTNQACAAIELKRGIAEDFVFHFLANQYEEIRKLSNSGSQDNLNGAIVRSIPILLPPESEQRAIATALSEVDGLIRAQEQLIAKKRDLKQAAMQQLLTAQHRLPGFSGEWVPTQLGTLGKCLRGVSYKPETDLFSHDNDRTIRLFRSNNVQENIVVTNDVQFVNRERCSDQQVMRYDDILVCMANGSKALVGKAGIFRINDSQAYTFGAFMACFRTRADVAHPWFIFSLFQTGRYRDYIANLLAGSSINNLRPSAVESLEFPIPPLPEQTAIAEVLSDMDEELAALETRLAKTRALKQGMMQSLLTGRIRLI